MASMVDLGEELSYTLRICRFTGSWWKELGDPCWLLVGIEQEYREDEIDWLRKNTF